MFGDLSSASGVGLERLCNESSGDWIRVSHIGNGIECLEAWFHGIAYHKHRHDTYAICLTTIGVQVFNYRGVIEHSLPGQVVVLHPDELHDGRAGSTSGFGYQILYIEPTLILEAVQMQCRRPCSLPFVRKPVIANLEIASVIKSVFAGTCEPLAIDSLIEQLAEGLIQEDPSCKQNGAARYFDRIALERARQFLDTEKTRVIRSAELEAVTGLTRFDLARQFRLMYGTSPYRYLLMRRLDVARKQLAQCHSLANVALDTGFADQAHFSRMFKAAYGLTPARYSRLRTSVTQTVQ